MFVWHKPLQFVACNLHCTKTKRHIHGWAKMHLQFLLHVYVRMLQSRFIVYRSRTFTYNAHISADTHTFSHHSFSFQLIYSCIWHAIKHFIIRTFLLQASSSSSCRSTFSIFYNSPSIFVPEISQTFSHSFNKLFMLDTWERLLFLCVVFARALTHTYTLFKLKLKRTSINLENLSNTAEYTYLV